jgi:hypothetical protein
MSRRSRPELTLVEERKLSDYIAPPEGSGVLEASGVVAKDGYYYVIFDNVRRVARIHSGLDRRSKKHGWFGRGRTGEGYEDIAFSPHTRRFYLLIEAEKHPDGTYKSIIDECDEAGTYKRRRWVDFAFEKRNTGFEGLSAVRFDGRNYLLALCEGNKCRGGKKGKKPGGGRIHVLERVGTMWRSITTIALPKSVKFEDYSAVAMRGTRIAVVSQETSRLWVGTIRFRDWSIAGRGTIYDFPRTKKGKTKYCTVEGLSFITPWTLVMVSDLCKKDYPKRCRKHEQSIHVFRIPTAQK